MQTEAHRSRLEQLAIDRVLRARIELSTQRRFYGALIHNVEPIPSWDFPTMATDGERHYFNPEFIMGLNKNHRGEMVPAALIMLGLQAHESEHDARHHSTRRGGRDPIKWNIACDYAINIDLIDQGFHLPWGALINAKYRGMSAEEIYRARELDEAKAKKKPDGGKPGEQGQPGQPSPNGQGQPQPGQPQGPGQPGQPGHPDPGGCGQVIDAKGGPQKQSELDQKWQTVVERAITQTGRGNCPGHVTREIERAKNPPRDWRDELREFCSQGSLRIETWNRPNRRFMGRGIVLPSSQKDGIGKAAFVIDTSGSMDAIALAAIRNEAQAMLDDGVIDEVVVIYGDTRVTRVDTYIAGDKLAFDPKGGGGTNLKPLFKHVADEVPDASVLICFTDLDIREPGPEPLCPVLFAVTGYPDRVKHHLANTPWGARGIDVGSH